MKTVEINVRAIYGYRRIGIGHTPLTKLCGFLNMPPPMTKNAYDDLSYSIKVAFKQVAGKIMSDAAARLLGTEQTADVGVSLDGTWQTKDFSSTPEIVTTISIDNSKDLDVAILSKSCKGYTSMKRIASSDTARYETCKLSHNYNLNYTGSSHGMETAQELLRSLVHQKRNMDYITLLFMEMVTARHILLSKIYMVQVNLLRNLNVSITIKNVLVRGLVIWKNHKRTWRKRTNH